MSYFTPSYPAKPRGLDPIRAAIALALEPHSLDHACDFAAKRWGGQSPVPMITKAMALSSLTDSGALAGIADVRTEFAELVLQRSIIERLPGIRRVPGNLRIVTQTDDPVAEWTSQGGPKQISTPGFDAGPLAPLKVTAAVVATRELIRDGGQRGELLIRDSLARALRKAVNSAFINPGNGGTPGEKPAAISSTATPIVSTGSFSTASGAAQLKADIGSMFDVANFTGDFESSCFITSFRTMASMQTSHYPVFPTMPLAEEGVATIPLIPSQALDSSGGSPVDSDYIILADGSAIMVTDAFVDIRVSSQATLNLGTATGHALTPTAENQTSLFQTNSVAFIGEMSINWTVPPEGRCVVLEIPRS